MATRSTTSQRPMRSGIGRLGVRVVEEERSFMR
jgi:hypothetical protein